MHTIESCNTQRKGDKAHTSFTQAGRLPVYRICIKALNLHLDMKEDNGLV